MNTPNILTKQIILHVPHSSTKIPIMEGFVVDESALNQEIGKLTDWFTDDLFYSASDEMIIADFSRIFCDPERFTDDSLEIMAQYGMGVLYEKNDDGERIRTVTPDLRERILRKYYRKHHERFNRAVNEQLQLHGKVIIIDCHSFPNNPLKRDLDQNSNRPDFNIGTDAFHTPQQLTDVSVVFFNRLGYTLGVNCPYSGSIVPMEYYQKNKNVQTIMLEINRKLYLNEASNEKSDNYSEIKRITNEFIKTIKTCW
ncbi:N-formylglutamate amidohydrolase [uncultured Draconibacterium sp.]|uniref:N-formylglutamate amidohydrolase n=1 Tax=uncultured Draconibacterium sp. TaxID=1573823 RepID=UPI0032163919